MDSRSEFNGTGVLLLNMGGPQTLRDVKPFLRCVFADRQVIQFPGGSALQGAWARLLAAMRAPRVQARYAAIGGGSPLLEWTRLQAQGLASRLGGASVEVAMRYSRPRAEEAIARLIDAGCRQLVLLPLYPQYCSATTGSSLADAARAIEKQGLAVDIVQVRSFHDDPGYVGAVSEVIREALVRFPKEVRDRVVVLFSAHGVPERLHLDGDPYVNQVRNSVDLVMAELADELAEQRLAFQSRAGPVRWIEPSTADVIRQLGGKGVPGVLVVPISFVSDHIETLHEIDVELKELAAQVGILHFRRASSLNDRSSFLDALAGLVIRTLGEQGKIDV